MGTRVLAGSATIVAALVLAGCSSSPAASGGPAAPASSAPPADGGSYPDANAVLNALSAAGSPCVEPSAIANPTLSGATSMIDCGSSVGNSDTVVVVFDSQANAVAYAAALTTGDMSAISQGSVVVYGQNWAVNTKAVYAPQVRAALGGQVVAGPSAGAS
jgi:hypothetical protein